LPETVPRAPEKHTPEISKPQFRNSEVQPKEDEKITEEGGRGRKREEEGGREKKRGGKRQKKKKRTLSVFPGNLFRQIVQIKNNQHGRDLGGAQRDRLALGILDVEGENREREKRRPTALALGVEDVKDGLARVSHF
jgi:hypothetical protein